MKSLAIALLWCVSWTVNYGLLFPVYDTIGDTDWAIDNETATFNCSSLGENRVFTGLLSVVPVIPAIMAIALGSDSEGHEGKFAGFRFTSTCQRRAHAPNQ